MDINAVSNLQQRLTSTERQLSEKAGLLSKTAEKLDSAVQQLSETRQQLRDVHDRLTVAEQLTASTQRRQLQQEGVEITLLTDDYDELQLLPTGRQRQSHFTSDGDYEQLRPRSAEESEYTQLYAEETPGTDVLRAQLTDLKSELEAVSVAVAMYQRNALTVQELQSIQTLRNRPVEAAEALLSFIMEQPADAVYLCFLDALKHTGQQYIYETLVEVGYEDYDDRSPVTRTIRAHYVHLLESLDSKFSGLVDQLVCSRVLSGVEADEINAEKTSFRANEKLLSALSGKSPKQFQLFIDALDICGQRHVRNVISDGDRPTLPPRASRTKLAAQQHLQTCPDYIQPSSNVIRTIQKAENIFGLTRMKSELFVLRQRDVDQVDVYSTSDFCLLRRLSLPRLSKDTQDITSCPEKKRIYVSDAGTCCVYLMGLDGSHKSPSKWPVKHKPHSISVTPSSNLLVIHSDENRSKCSLIELSSETGRCVREVKMGADVQWVYHAVRLGTGQYVVCHGGKVCGQRVSVVDPDGRITHSNNGDGGLSAPCHVTVDDRQFVLVADLLNHRIVLFDSSLKFVRNLTERMQYEPCSLCLHGGRLYVGQTDGIVSVIEM